MTVMESRPAGDPRDDAQRFERLQDRLNLLAVAVQRTVRELDALWSDTLDHGELMVRVVEASHALHRAVLALEGDPVIGGGRTS